MLDPVNMCCWRCGADLCEADLWDDECPECGYGDANDDSADDDDGP